MNVSFFPADQAVQAQTDLAGAASTTTAKE